MGDRKSIGAASRRRSQPSPLDSGEGEEQEPFDLSELDWGRVVTMAEGLAKRIPPRTTDDRRFWLKFAVLAETSFSESWLVDSAEAVIQARESRKGRQAHFMGVVKSKAVELGVQDDTFTAMLRRIEIPANVWKSGVLEIRT